MFSDYCLQTSKILLTFGDTFSFEHTASTSTIRHMDPVPLSAAELQSVQTQGPSQPPSVSLLIVDQFCSVLSADVSAIRCTFILADVELYGGGVERVERME